MSKALESPLKYTVRELLDANQDENKKDCQVYFSGHLGPKGFKAVPTEKKSKIWNSSRPTPKESLSFQNSKVTNTESLTFLKNDENQMKPTKEQKYKLSKNSFQTSASEIHENEEIKLPEVMLPRVSSNLNLPPSQQSKTRKHYEKYEFVSTYLAGVTNKDQYDRMVDFEKNVLYRSGVGNPKVVGSEGIKHLEEKIIVGMFNLNKSKSTKHTALKKLNLYSSVWNDMIKDSSLYGRLLKEIKHEYDLHLTSTISTTKDSKYNELARCNQLVGDMASGSNECSDIQAEVDNLSAQCEKALLRNAKLHKKLNQQIKLSTKKVEENKKYKSLLKMSFSYWRKSAMKKKLQEQININQFDSKKSKKERVKKLKETLLSELESYENEKAILKKDFFPKILAEGMKVSLKSLTTDIHRLQQQSYINLVLNIEKKNKIEELLTCFKGIDPTFVGETKGELESMKFIPEDMSKEMGLKITPHNRQAVNKKIEQLRNNLIKPELIDEFTRKLASLS